MVGFMWAGVVCGLLGKWAVASVGRWACVQVGCGQVGWWLVLVRTREGRVGGVWVWVGGRMGVCVDRWMGWWVG